MQLKKRRSFKVDVKGRGITGKYAYGYQGSRSVDELEGEGNTYTTEFRQLDSRLGIWRSPDPVFQPWQSPYNSMDGNPINYTDVRGLSVGEGDEVQIGKKTYKAVEISRSEQEEVRKKGGYYNPDGNQTIRVYGEDKYVSGDKKNDKIYKLVPVEPKEQKAEETNTTEIEQESTVQNKEPDGEVLGNDNADDDKPNVKEAAANFTKKYQENLASPAGVAANTFEQANNIVLNDTYKEIVKKTGQKSAKINFTGKKKLVYDTFEGVKSQESYLKVSKTLAKIANVTTIVDGSTRIFNAYNNPTPENKGKVLFSAASYALTLASGPAAPVVSIVLTFTEEVFEEELNEFYNWLFSERKPLPALTEEQRAFIGGYEMRGEGMYQMPTMLHKTSTLNLAKPLINSR